MRASLELVRVGVVILPESPWASAEEVWRRAEALGFHHAWTYDHLAWGALRDSAWFASVPTLTGAAVVTDRIRLGTLVASPNFRHPVPFARELVTLDHFSGGRFTLGIGAGGHGWDATILGNAAWSLRERAERFAEFVDLTDRLLRQTVTSFDGRYYAAHEAPTYPGCVQHPRIPFAVAAEGPRAMRLAAAYGQTWVTTGGRERDGLLDAEAGAAAVREQVARLDEVCASTGRDPRTLDRLVLTGLRLDPGLTSVEEFRDTAGHYEEVGVTDLVVHWPRAGDPFKADLATFEAIFS